MASMPPGFLQQQMEAMKGMSPDVLQQQMAAANRADPAVLEQQMKGAAAMARQQEEYQVCLQTKSNLPNQFKTGLSAERVQIRASNQLKEQGNKLFSAQRTTEAIEKYQLAKANLSGQTFLPSQLKISVM